MVFRNLLKLGKNRRQVLVEGVVVADRSRCVQCGICSYNCPIDIDVRRYAWEGRVIENARCLTCGQCIARCPRNVLVFETSKLFQKAPRAGGQG